jgi:heme a synthase
MSRAALVRSLALAACLLCFGVVVLGAYVRLSNAGLGCPDWPGCYGHLTPAAAAADPHTRLNPLDARPLQIGKAWREMVHRYAAGTLAFLIVCLAAMGITWRRERVAPLGYVITLFGVVIVQAALGMLTVTWQLTPLIVTLHLLFGLTTLSLLWWLVLTLWRRRRSSAWSDPAGESSGALKLARALAATGLLVLIGQIALGGWTSSNYAALACPDLPTCQGSFWPHADFRAAFTLWHPLNVDYEGGVLAGPARVAIQLVHRFGALATALALLCAAGAAIRASRPGPIRTAGALLILMLALQLGIGMSMVLRGFPLWLATAHNAGAALLLLATLALNRALNPARLPLDPLRVPQGAH